MNRYSAIDVAEGLQLHHDWAVNANVATDWEPDGPDVILRLENGQVFRIEVTELTTDYPDHPDYPGPSEVTE